MNSNKYLIDNIEIVLENKVLMLTITKKTDILSLFVVIKFLVLLEDLQVLYIIDKDYKNVVTYSKENYYSLQDFSLNNFLNYYSARAVAKENNSGYDDNSELKKIIGWRFLFKDNITFGDEEINILRSNIDKYKKAKKGK